MQQHSSIPYHTVEIHHDGGNSEYLRAAPELAKLLAVIEESHQPQGTVSELVEHAHVTLQRLLLLRGTHQPTGELADAPAAARGLLEAPLAKLCCDAFAFLSSDDDDSVHHDRSHDYFFLADCASASMEGIGEEATDGRPSGFHKLVDHRLIFEALEHLTYVSFFNSYERLSQGVAQGNTYSACEARWNVLRARYRLHRAFNAEVEDHHHSVMGGGDVAFAAKYDVRRIGTSMSAQTLIRFINEKYQSVRRESSTSPSSPCQVTDAFEAFFGPNRPDEERVITAEGLSLRPHLAQSTDRRLDVFEKQNPMRPRGDHALQLLKHFLKFQYGDSGRMLAELIHASLPSQISDREGLELELTVHGLRSGEIDFLADWCDRFDFYRYEPKMRVSLRVVLMKVPAADGNTEKKYPNCDHFGSVLNHLFTPLWNGLLFPSKYPRLARFLSILNGISVAVDDASESQSLPTPGTRLPSNFSLDSSDGLPPDAYFFFYMWRNTQLFNLGVLAMLLKRIHRVINVDHLRFAHDAVQDADPLLHLVVDRSLQFRIHSDNKLRSLSHCISGLLLADSIANPMRLTQWSPLGYLYYLTQRHIVLSPSVNNAMNAPFSSTKSALVALIEVGANVSVASMDPLHHHCSDAALVEELTLLQKVYCLSATDVTELCLRSVENANLSVHEIRKWMPHSVRWSASLSGVDIAGSSADSIRTLPPAARPSSSSSHRPYAASTTTATSMDWGALAYHSHRPFHSITALYNRFSETQVPSARLAFREMCHSHEIDLLRSTVVPLSPLLGATAQKLVATAEMHVRFPRLVVRGHSITGARHSTVAKSLIRVLQLREGYRIFNLGSPDHEAETDLMSKNNAAGSRVVLQTVEGVKMVNGVITPIFSGLDTKGSAVPASLASWPEYVEHYRTIRRLVHDSEAQLFCKRRLATLEHKFHLHCALTDPNRVVSAVSQNQDAVGDMDGGQGSPRTPPLTLGGGRDPSLELSDLDRAVKVDVHCHMASGMTAQQLLRFITNKVEASPDDVVCIGSAGKLLKRTTIRELLLRVLREKFGPQATLQDMSVSALDVQAFHRHTFNRFDQFNNKYNPLGLSELRSLFLKTDNEMGGRYFAELIKDTLEQQPKNTFTEFRLSIYGRSRDEWSKLAQWWYRHGVNHKSNRWIIQVPRIYSIYRREGSVGSFADLLANVFMPLWDVTLRPDSDPILTAFLQHVSGFDSVDNESGTEPELTSVASITPEQWTAVDNPPFSFWMYHFWANIATLNRVRCGVFGLPAFAFRPHCGESGDPDHLIDALLLADGIGHGVQLRRRSVLQYLFYLTQIGLGMTPLSNNALFCRYFDNPFPQFFSRGLLVALATDGPLQFHHTHDPLMEEYATAMKYWSLSTVDVCEIASHSVRMSSFPPEMKRKWHGDLFALRSTAGNDVTKSRVPHQRVAFRYEVYENECRYVENRAALSIPRRAMLSVALEDLVCIDTVGLTQQQVVGKRMRGEPVTQQASTTTHQPSSKL